MYRSYRKLYESISESYPFISEELINDFPDISERIIKYYTDEVYSNGRMLRDFNGVKKTGAEYAYIDYHEDPSGDCFLCIRIGDKKLVFRLYKISTENKAHKLTGAHSLQVGDYLDKNFKGDIDPQNKEILSITEKESADLKEFMDSIFTPGSAIDKERLYKGTKDSTQELRKLLRKIIDGKPCSPEDYFGAIIGDLRYSYFRDADEKLVYYKGVYFRKITYIIEAINRSILVSASSTITRESIFSLPKWEELASFGWKYIPNETQWKNGNIAIDNPLLPIAGVIIFSNGYIRPPGQTISPLKRLEPITSLDDWTERLEYADQYATRAFCKKIGFTYKKESGMKEMTKIILSSRKVTVDQILELAKFNLTDLLGDERGSSEIGKFAGFISVTGNMAI